MLYSLVAAAAASAYFHSVCFIFIIFNFIYKGTFITYSSIYISNLYNKMIINSNKISVNAYFHLNCTFFLTKYKIVYVVAFVY